MPTGYTYKIDEGKISTLGEYARECARAIDVFIEMRDLPFNTPLPEKFELDISEEMQELNECKNKLEELLTLSDEKIAELSEAEYAEELQSHNKYEADNDVIRERYTAMRLKVENWEVPETLSNLKKFMLEQLETGKPYPPSKPYHKKLNPSDWRDRESKYLIEKTHRLNKRIEDAHNNFVFRNNWIRDFKTAVKDK